MVKAIVKKKPQNGTKKKTVANARQHTSPNVQGAVRAVGKAFGGKSSSTLRALDAFDPAHMSLPRAVGDYTVTRVTQQFQSAAPLIILCPFRAGYSTDPLLTNATDYTVPRWSANVGLQFVGMNYQLNEKSALGRVYGVNMVALEQYGTASIVPSAFSVQIMCPTALQTASGIAYAGVSTSQLKKYRNEGSETAAGLASNFVSYMKPRILTAGKMALRGVQIDSYPLDMNELAQFAPVSPFVGGATDPEPNAIWDEDDSSAIGSDCVRANPAGFAPIVIYNPSSIGLQYLVTMELRTRFDLSSPAAASHSFHPPTSEQHWARVAHKAASRGNNVRDIAEGVLAKGQPTR